MRLAHICKKLLTNRKQLAGRKQVHLFVCNAKKIFTEIVKKPEIACAHRVSVALAFHSIEHMEHYGRINCINIIINGCMGPFQRCRTAHLICESISIIFI